jgi:osmotically-inducible protein OsmY
MKMRPALPFGLVLIACLLQGCVPVREGDATGKTGTAKEHDNIETYRADRKIETTAIDRIYGQFRILIHVNVTSFNRNVLISGEVPDEATRAAIEKIVSGVESVRHLNNELVISANSSLASRSNDSLITTSVKLRFARDNRINAEHIKAVTENATVFLMGNVRHAEADAAAEIASTTSKVVRVVKLFEYTD